MLRFTGLSVAEEQPYSAAADADDAVATILCPVQAPSNRARMPGLYGVGAPTSHEGYAPSE